MIQKTKFFTLYDPIYLSGAIQLLDIPFWTAVDFVSRLCVPKVLVVGTLPTKFVYSADVLGILL